MSRILEGGWMRRRRMKMRKTVRRFLERMESNRLQVLRSSRRSTMSWMTCNYHLNSNNKATTKHNKATNKNNNRVKRNNRASKLITNLNRKLNSKMMRIRNNNRTAISNNRMRTSSNNKRNNLSPMNSQCSLRTVTTTKSNNNNNNRQGRTLKRRGN